jgi:hypothetical protein
MTWDDKDRSGADRFSLPISRRWTTLSADAAFDERWSRLLSLRSAITRVLERARRDKVIGLSLDAEVVLQVNGEWADFPGRQPGQLRELCIVSNLRLAGGRGRGSGLHRDGRACRRGDRGSGRLRASSASAAGPFATSVGDGSDHPALCARCAVWSGSWRPERDGLMGVFCWSSLAVVWLDQATKFWIMHHFALYESKVVIPDCSISPT